MARAYASSVINAPIEQVWAHIRDYNGLPAWHPGVKTSRIENDRPANEVGAIRLMELADGGMIREELVAFSDDESFYTYTILESPLPVANYKATLRLRPISDGNRTYGAWEAHFEADPPDAREDAEALISTGVFQGGFDALKQHFGG
jgi:uncharacterized protein YndB with AHSA1/START domain